MTGGRTVFPLPGPDGPRMLKLDLALVAALEEETSLLKTAEQLAARELTLTGIIALLRRVYRAAGLPEVPDEFLLQQAPALLLAEILLAILSPLAEMGVLPPGKNRPAPAA